MGIVETESMRERRCGPVFWLININKLPSGTKLYTIVKTKGKMTDDMKIRVDSRGVEIKSNRAWREECVSLVQRVAKLEGYEQECANLDAELKDYQNCLAELTTLKQSQGEPVGYVRDYALRFMHENNRATSIKPQPLADNDIPLYTSAKTIPEGWQLVPIEPTSEMILAAVKGQSNRTTVPRDDELAAGMYYDMLAAAPKLGDKE